jgi:hypothetical protein
VRRSVFDGALNAAEFIGRDATDTVRRMQDDARHLAELAKKGKIALGMAATAAQNDIERALGRFVDRASEVAKRVRGRGGKA